MPLNPFFKNYSFVTEQNVHEDLIIEAIKIYGVEALYLPRTLVNEDLLYSEDTLSLFDNAIELEVYMLNIEGVGGEKDLMSKFGFEVRDEVDLSVSQKRFRQAMKEGLLAETSYRILLEDGDQIILESGTDQGYDYSQLSHPREGDLLYLPMIDAIFEIKHVEDEEIFYQTGKLFTFTLKVERMTYSSERVETANSYIDGLADARSLDMRNFQIQLEDGDILQLEDGNTFIQEAGANGYGVRSKDLQGINEFIQQVSANGVISYSETDPFSENSF